MMALTGRLTAATTLAVLALGCGSAWAADAEAFGTRLTALLADQNTVLTYDAAESEGDNVILRGSTLTNGEQPATLGDLTFESVTGSTEAGWQVERLPFNDFETTSEDSQMELSGMEITGIELLGTQPGADVPEVKKLSPIYFDSARIGSGTVTRMGEEIMSFSDTSFTNEITDAGLFSGNFSSGNVTVNFPESDPSEAPKTMRELGYETLSGSLESTATWDPQSGRLALDPVSFDVEEAGDLTMTFAISGYTAEVGQSFAQIQQQMAQNPDNSNAGMAIMGLLSALTVESARIGFSDASLTERLLGYYAEEAGQTPEQIVSGAVATVEGMAGALQNPQFQEQVVGAVRSFLEDPQSIAIAIAPQQPIPAMQIVGAVMGAPQTLPEVLSLSVEANQGQ